MREEKEHTWRISIARYVGRGIEGSIRFRRVGEGEGEGLTERDKIHIIIHNLLSPITSLTSVQ